MRRFLRASRKSVLAVLEGLRDDAPRGVDAAHKLHKHIDFRVIDEPGRVGGELGAGGERHLAGLAGVAHEHGPDGNVAAGAPADDVGIVGDEAREAAAHGAKASQSHAQGARFTCPCQNFSCASIVWSRS